VVERDVRQNPVVGGTFSPFLEAAAAAADLLAQPEVGQHWNDDSVLELLPVSGLAGHLLRGLTTVETYLGSPPPSEEPISVAEYFARLVSSDINAPGNQAIRARAAEMAADGPAAVADAARATYGQLLARLPGESPGRRLRVAGDLVMTLAEYLRTRVVELVVHGDDLAASVGLGFGPISSDVATTAIGALVEVARVRHDDMAVLRALARRERDAVQALRVI
jgi:Mycothiol maleylpyruvate isomerase N-terminal domain